MGLFGFVVTFEKGTFRRKKNSANSSPQLHSVVCQLNEDDDDDASVDVIKINFMDKWPALTVGFIHT